jgi:unconventional prefoldin RPB5 interactor 1
MQNISDLTYANMLRTQLDATVVNLNYKKKHLDDQMALFENLAQEIEKSSASKFTVLIGDGYFVEKNRDDAKEFVEKRRKEMRKISCQVGEKIDEATRTKTMFDKLKGLPHNLEEENKLNEEGLPYMDIQEELDDDGNVISTKVNNEEVEYDDSYVVVKPSPKVGKQANEDANTENVIVSDETVEKDEREPSIENSSLMDTSNSQPDKVSDLFEEMHITATQRSNVQASLVDQDELLEKIDSLKISPEDKFKLKQIAVEQYKTLQEDTEGEQLQGEVKPTVVKTEGKENLTKTHNHKEKIISEIIKENDPDDNKQTTSIDSTRSIDIDENNLLELELIADLLDDSGNSHVEFSDDEEWDFEFDDDDDGDDPADELLYGGRPSFFNSSENDNSNKLLWDQVFALREAKSKRPCENETSSAKGKKSVRFAEKLEIKEIENISESLKNMNYDKKVSLFKQNRTSFRKVDEKKFTTNAVSEVNDKIIEIPLVEHGGKMSAGIKKINVNSTFQSDLMVSDGDQFPILDRKSLLEKSLAKDDENINLNREETGNSMVESTESHDVPPNKPKKKLSKFKQMKQEAESCINSQTQTAYKVSDSPSDGIINDIIEKDSHITTDIVEKGGLITTDVVEKDIPVLTEEEDKIDTEDQTSSEIKEVQFDYESINDDLETMAKAYVLGMYDDDIATEGPIVNELKDFEQLNELLQSKNTSKDVTLQKAGTRNSDILNDPFDPQLDEIERQDEFDDDEDDEGPILSDFIVENDIDLDDSESHNTLEDDFLNQEVVASYHKLRQKILFDNKVNGYRKDEQELEFEPIDESGNSVKISRFKAARLR